MFLDNLKPSTQTWPQTRTVCICKHSSMMLHESGAFAHTARLFADILHVCKVIMQGFEGESLTKVVFIVAITCKSSHCTAGCILSNLHAASIKVISFAQKRHAGIAAGNVQSLLLLLAAHWSWNLRSESTLMPFW